MLKRWLGRLLKFALFLGQAALIVFVTLVLAGAFAARARVDLDIWHTMPLESEFRAGQGIETLEQYLVQEELLFEELDRKIIDVIGEGSADELNRFRSNSLSNPVRDGHNWNRTAIYRPAVSGGGILMLHGMTDSPYSLRHMARLFQARGFYVVNLRLPGHGTIPGELARVGRQDWAAAVRLAAENVQANLQPDQPFFIMGYSNGASLAVRHTLDALEDTKLRIPDRLVLLSPMMGVSGLARFGRIYYWLSKLDYFEKAAWLDILPEYDPHKYNSFPMNAPRQSLALTAELDRRLRRMASTGAIKAMPPVLTFQSLVDSTVLTRAILTRLYDRLPANGSELVMFDINREGVLDYFVQPQHDALIELMEQAGPLAYTISLVSNRRSGGPRVGLFRKRPFTADVEYSELPHAWPVMLYSLSHVAVPFPPDDEVYGFEAPPVPGGFPRLGMAQGMGESGALLLPASLFTRARSNPFYDWMVKHLLQATDQASN